MSISTNWDSVWRWLTCWLFEQMGLECHRIGTPEHAIGLLEEVFDKEGLPPFANAQEKAAFAAHVDALLAHINLPESTLTPDVDLRFRVWIAQVQAALHSTPSGGAGA